MPRSRSRWRNENCWERRTGLEKILIGASVIVILIVATLVTILLLRLANISRSITCTTLECINETSEITQRLDPSINPCEDFYQFSCGNLLKAAHGDEKLGPFFVIKERAEREIEEMYSEPFKENEHDTVKIAKKLYRACLNETAIKQDGLQTIKEAVKSLGGWPVAEGENWHKEDFSWRKTTRDLRKLGYFHASLLEISVETDPENSNRFIFQVSVPDERYFKRNARPENQLVLMADIAVTFGAKRERAIIEMAETYDFMLDMGRENSLYFQNEPVRRMQVGEFQKMCDIINWQETINEIVGPALRIYEADYVLFPSPMAFQHWLDFLSNTPSRTLANYMIWKAIEKVIPYTEELNNLQLEHKNYMKRPEFCMKLIRESFSPSPIDLMYLRKYLPATKREEVLELVRNLQYEFVNILENADWMDPTDKYDILEKARRITVNVGAPGDYFDDEILDELHMDMDKVGNNETLLSLLSKVNRNHQSHIFSQIYNYRSESELNRWSLETHSIIGDYNREENIINLPATILQGVIFNEQRPTYLNYGSMGTMMGHHFLNVLGESTTIFDKDGSIINQWSNTTRAHFEAKTECIRKQMDYLNLMNTYTVDFILHHSLGLKLSYAAYNGWAINHEDQARTILGADYAPNQLFWISAASYFCQPLNPYSKILTNAQDIQLFASLVSGSILNNREFSKDFNCPQNSKMNPTEKCEIF